MVEQQPSKLRTRVRFSLPAPANKIDDILDKQLAAASDPDTTGEWDDVDYEEGGDGKVYPI